MGVSSTDPIPGIPVGCDISAAAPIMTPINPDPVRRRCEPENRTNHIHAQARDNPE